MSRAGRLRGRRPCQPLHRHRPNFLLPLREKVAEGRMRGSAVAPVDIRPIPPRHGIRIGDPMKHPKALREAVRRAYESGASYTRLSRQFRIARETARHWAIAAGGSARRRPSSPARAARNRATARVASSTARRMRTRSGRGPRPGAGGVRRFRPRLGGAAGEPAPHHRPCGRGGRGAVGGWGTLPPDDRTCARSAPSPRCWRGIALETPTRTDRDGRDDPDTDGESAGNRLRRSAAARGVCSAPGTACRRRVGVRCWRACGD